jgi:hypothetical protein
MSTNYFWHSTFSKTKISRSENKLDIDFKDKSLSVTKEEIESVKLIKSRDSKYNKVAIAFPLTLFVIFILNFEIEFLHLFGYALFMLPFFAFAYYFKFNKYKLILVTTNKEKIRIDANSKWRNEIKSLFYVLNSWNTKKSTSS